MRKVALLALVAAIAMAGAVPASGAPSVRRDELAFADWMVPTKVRNEFTWYGAYVRRSEVLVGGRWFSFAGFASGKCLRTKTERATKISCKSNKFVEANPRKDFEMSPLVDEAELRKRQGGRTHVVSWAATPPSTLYGSQEWCWSVGSEGEEEEGQGYGGGIWSPSEAAGRLFGETMKTDGKFALMASGFTVTTCSFRSVDYDPATGSLPVEFYIPR